MLASVRSVLYASVSAIFAASSTVTKHDGLFFFLFFFLFFSLLMDFDLLRRNIIDRMLRTPSLVRVAAWLIFLAAFALYSLFSHHM
jgi:hypothetical protein